MFSSESSPDNEQYRLVSQNPVASAQFFCFIVKMFIKHMLEVDQKHLGLYSNTAAYYGAVEQQERLTLHLHMLF